MAKLKSNEISIDSLADHCNKLETTCSNTETALGDRLNEIESKWREIIVAAEKLENWQSEVELRENSLVERRKELEKNERELKTKLEIFEEKAKRFEEIMVVKLAEIEGMKMKEEQVERREKEVEERFRELDYREGVIIEKEECLEMKLKNFDEKCRALDTREKLFDAKLMEFELKCKEIEVEEQCKCECQRSNMVKVEEECEGHISQEVIAKQSKEVLPIAPHPEAYHDFDKMQRLCSYMDASGFSSYLIEHFEDSMKLLKKFSDSLHLAQDPAELVFNVIQKLYDIMESNHVTKQIYTLSCIILPPKLLMLKVNVTPHLKDAARKFSNVWKGFLYSRGCNAPEIYGFLQFLAAYKLAQSHDTDELLSFLGVFYTETEVLWPERSSYLCRILGLMKFIPGIIQSLIEKKEHLRAVVCICAFKMEDAFPLAFLLSSDWECIKKRAEKMVDRGGISTQKAVEMELSGMKSLLKCIYNFKLESSFSPGMVQMRIKHLEKEMIECSMREKKEYIPGEDTNQHAHIKSGKKRTSTSMESRKRSRSSKVSDI